MTTRKEDTVNKVASSFETWKKILGPLFLLGGAIASFTVAWIEIKDNKAKIIQMDATYKQMIQEMMRDTKREQENEHELTLKNIQRINDLKERMNEHEIEAAEFRGKLKAILKIN